MQNIQNGQNFKVKKGIVVVPAIVDPINTLNRDFKNVNPLKYIIVENQCLYFTFFFTLYNKII